MKKTTRMFNGGLICFLTALLVLCFGRGRIYAQAGDIDLNPTDVDILDYISNPSVIQVENSVFISPRNKLVVLNSNNTHGPVGGVSNLASNDGGLTWTGNVGLMGGLGDPCVVIDNNGWFYIAYLNGAGIPMLQSKDGGATWSLFTVAVNPGSNPSHFLDKPHLWVDNSSASMYEGRLYAAWRIADPVGPVNEQIQLSYSTNQGQSWTPTSLPEISSLAGGGFKQGVNIQTGPKGEVYVCWAISPSSSTQENAIGFAQSLDGGVTWPIIKKIPFISIRGESNSMGLGAGKSMNIHTFPSMTVNKQTGEIYIVWSEYAAINNTDGDINMIKSKDGGNTWSGKIRVNQDALGNGIDQWFPWVACDEVSGALVVLYYDAGPTLWNTSNNNTTAQPFVSISYDEGMNWQDFNVSPELPQLGGWSADGIGGGFGSYVGDYIGIDVFHGRAVPVWADNVPRITNGPTYMLARTHPFEVPCPHNLTLCTSAVITGSATMPGEAVYHVNNVITVGGSTACSYSIANTGDVTMEAGLEIQLKEGFSAQGEFRGTIANCTSFSQRTVNASYGETDNPGAASGLIARKSYEFSVFPNPTNGRFKLILNNLEEFPTSIVLEDLLGKPVVILSDVHSFAFDLDLENYPTGMFIVKVNYPHRTIAKRVIKN